MVLQADALELWSIWSCWRGGDTVPNAGVDVEWIALRWRYGGIPDDMAMNSDCRFDFFSSLEKIRWYSVCIPSVFFFVSFFSR